MDPYVVEWRGNDSPDVPLVLLLHGRGGDEQDIVRLADYLPPGLAYVALRAAIPEGEGYAWFERLGVGRPAPESLREQVDWCRRWLDSAVPESRPVVPVGFSGGAAMAGALMLDDPGRYAGAAILNGTLPFDAGVPHTPGHLVGLPVLVAQGEHDDVIPRELLDRTWAYLTEESGADATAHRFPTGHEMAPETVAALHQWLAPF